MMRPLVTTTTVARGFLLGGRIATRSIRMPQDRSQGIGWYRKTRKLLECVIRDSRRLLVRLYLGVRSLST